MTSLMEMVRQKKAALQSGNRAKTAKPAEGRSRWRILPTWRKAEGETQFWHDFGQHFIKDGTGTLKAVYVCTDKTYGRPCKVCDAISQGMHATNDDAMVELIKGAKANGRVLLNALEISGDKPTEPQILEVSPSVFASILGLIEEWGDKVISLGADGMDIIIERVGKGLNTKYSVQIAAKSQPCPADVMKKVTDLDEYVKQESAEQERRALTNLSAVAGSLPAPSASSAAKPSLSDVPEEADHDGTNDIGTATPAAEAGTIDLSGDADLEGILAGIE